MKALALATMLTMAMACRGAEPATSFIRVADSPLVFTGQVFAEDKCADVREEVARALQALESTLTKAGADLTRVVRLNVYVADDGAVAEVETLIAKRFAQTSPALTVVRTPLTRVGAVVAFEAVAISSHAVSTVKTLDSAAVMPAGGKIFISGQAARGSDLASAVRLTMAGLHRSVAYLGLQQSDIVQVKAFIKPFADHAAVLREVAAGFEGAPPPPPVVVMEWVSDLYAEIELVVSARSLATTAGEKITHAWLPWLTKSTRFCNVTHVAAGTPLIFIGAIHGGDDGDARRQMKTIFERLGSTLFEAGSSYRYLAKATYYLAHPDARALLGDIRDVYFDPARPPAASALNMHGLGRAGRAAMVDIVAVPAK